MQIERPPPERHTAPPPTARFTFSVSHTSIQTSPSADFQMPFLLSSISYRIASWLRRRRFPNPTIASQRLGRFGNVAGKIDAWEDGWLRGWIYDAGRPDHIITLDVFVDGNLALRTVADQYRDDLASLLQDNGIHGFEVFVPALLTPGLGQLEIMVRVADRARYAIGPIVGERSSPTKRPAPDGLIDGTLDDRLRHIFNHITGAHENALRRFDSVQISVDRIVTAIERKDASDHALPERTAISGVGQLADPLPDAVEQLLLERGIRDAIRKRLSESISQ